MSIFKANDVRGVFPEEVDGRVYEKLGRTLALLAKSGGAFVVGGDARISTEELKGALIEGLLTEGARVIDVGQVTTPECYFAKRAENIPNLAMITASHNPPEYNGLKIMTGQRAPTEEVLGEFRTIYEELPAKGVSSRGTCSDLSVRDAYREWLKSSAPKAEPKKIVFDAGNGPLGAFGPGILRELGHDVIELNCEVDGNFPGRDPNCALEANLHGAMKAVIETGADLALAFDGDADRLTVIDSDGSFISADELANLMVRTRAVDVSGAKVIHDIKCASIVANAVRETGGEPLVEKSGHAYIRRRMRREDARFGVEVSGHLFYRELAGGDDALYSGLRVLAMSGRGALGPLRRELTPTYFITPDIRIEVGAAAQEEIILLLGAYHNGHPQSRVDGLRVDFADGWALVRKSITEPRLTFRFESASASGLSALVGNFIEPLEDELREKIVAEFRKGASG